MNETQLKIRLGALIKLAHEINIHNFEINAPAIVALVEDTIEEIEIESMMATRYENAPFRA